MVTDSAMSCPLRGGTDEDQAALGARNGALDEQQATLDVDLVHGQALRRVTLAAHSPRHLHALGPAARRGRDAVEAVTLHNTRGALALGRTRDVDLDAGREQLGGELLADRVTLDRLGAHLDEVASRGDVGGLEVAGHRLRHLAWVDLP